MASLPNAPNITIRPDARDQALKFFWSAPTPNGSPPVLSYQLTDGTNTVSLPAAATFYTYSGLTNGTSYTFRIAASNANGLGPYAFYRTVQPGLTPGTPALSTVISSVGSLNYTVGWSNPSDLGGATGLLGTLLTAVPIDSNGNLNMTSSLWIQTTVLGGNSNAFQQAVVQLTSNYNYRINIQPVVDAGYSRIPVYTSTISSSFVAQPVFTPSTIAGMQLWLDGADSTSLTLSTSNVTQWNDKSGNAKNFSNTTGSARPVYNSTLSSLFFNNSLLDGAQIISTNQRNIHFFGVWSVSTTTGATFQAVFEQNVLTASNGYRFMVYGSPFSGRSGNFYGLNGYGTNPTPVDGFPTFTVNSTMMSYIGANSDGTTFTVTNRHNGSLYSTQTISQANMNVAAATTRFGRRVGGTEEPYFGRMSEVLLYSSILSANQYATLEGYLAWKWGLSTLLPSTHPFYSRAPLVTDSNLDFSPSSIGTMRLWLDAADVGTISTSGSSVLRWADKSGSNNHASGGTSPSFTSSNLGVIFNGSQVLNLPDGTLPINDTDYSIFFNVSASNVTSGIWWLSQGTTNSNVLGSPIYNGAVWHSWGTAGEISSLALTNNIPFIASMTYTSGTRLLIKDGIWNNGDAKTGRATTAGNARLGKSEQFAQFFTGNVREVLVYQSNVTLRQRQQVEGYMAWKWGLQANLPSTHLYYFRAPTRLDTFSNFSPSSVSGLRVWIDAADASTVTLSSIYVSTITDKSSNAYVFTGANGFTYNSTVKFNTTFPSFYNDNFNNTRHLGSNMSVSITQPMTFFVVAHCTETGSGNNVIFDSQTGNNRLVYSSKLGSFYGEMYAGGAAGINTTSNFTGTPYMATAYYSTANSVAFSNGTTTAYTSGNPGSSNLVTLLLGNRFISGGIPCAHQGHICEMLFYSGALSSRDRQNVEGYLSWKWGIQSNVPVSHPFRYGSTVTLGPISSS